MTKQQHEQQQAPQGANAGEPNMADSQLTTRLSTFAKQAKEDDEQILSSMTDFDWDRVYAFRDGFELAALNGAVGTDLFDEPIGRLWTHSTLLVFTNRASVVHAIMTPASLQVLAREGEPYDRATTVVRASSLGSPPWLLLSQHGDTEQATQ